MKRLFAFVMCAMSLGASAQSTITYPYNPDGNADGYINLDDLLDFLEVYGMSWSADEVLGCTYAVSPNFHPLATMDDGTCIFPVDCAGVVNGGAVEDDCGVCDGDNSTCENSCSSCGYWDDLGVWQSGGGPDPNQHRQLIWNGTNGGGGFSLPPNSNGSGLFETLDLGVVLDETLAGAPALYDLSGLLLDFSGTNAETVITLSSGAVTYQEVPSVANASSHELLPSEPPLAGHFESDACAFSSSLPQENLGGSNNSSPQRWDFIIRRVQSNTNPNPNSLFYPTWTEGDRYYALRYHSGSASIGESFDGFGSILFQFREWIYVAAGSPYAQGGPLHNPENFFPISGGGWLEVSGMPGNPGMPVANLSGVGECQLCYAYNDINPQAVDTSAPWYANLSSTLNLPVSFYSLSGGICLGATPQVDP